VLSDGFARCLVDDRAPGKVRHTLRDGWPNGSSGSPAAIPMRRTPIALPMTPFTSSCSDATPSSGTRSPRNRRSRGFENRVEARERYTTGRDLAVSVIEPSPAAPPARPPDHRSRPDRRPDPPRATTDLLSMGTTTAGGICRCWRSSPSTTKPIPVCGDPPAGQCVGEPRGDRDALPLARRAAGSVFRGHASGVRLDGRHVTPEVLDFLDAEPGLDYVVAMAKNTSGRGWPTSGAPAAVASGPINGACSSVRAQCGTSACQRGSGDHLGQPKADS
jgi:hypothetical protein